MSLGQAAERPRWKARQVDSMVGGKETSAIRKFQLGRSMFPNLRGAAFGQVSSPCSALQCSGLF
jgi:hypothetical protein